MHIILLNSTNTQSVLRQVTRLLKHGGVIVYPTDTAYAIGGAALQPRVTAKVFKIKGREKNKPLPLIISSLAQAERVAHFSSPARTLAKRFWPGPLSVLLPAKALVPAAVHAGTKYIVLRVPKNSLARTLARRIGQPLISTSANLSGKPMHFDAQEVAKEFAHRPRAQQPDIILDAGRLRKSKPSTIVGWKNGKLILIRQGKIIILNS